MIHHCVDPVALALTARHAPFELMSSPRGKVFRRVPHTLAGLYRASRLHGPKRMVQTDAEAWTFDQTFARADSFARALIDEFGVRPGDHVAMAMMASADWMAAFIAVTSVGAVAAMINTRCTSEEMVHAIQLVDARLVIADATRAAALQAHPASFAWRMILDGADALIRDDCDASLSALLQYADGPYDLMDLAVDDPAVVLFTSGTTGFPKAARLDHGTLAHGVGLAGLAGAIQDQRFSAESGRTIPIDRASSSAATVIAAPVFHVGGIIPFLRGLYFGAPMFVLAKWDAEVALDLMEREPMSRLGFVPTMLSDMLISPRAGAHNVGKLMVLSSGAAQLDDKLVERVKAAVPDVMIANTYGQTETAGWISTICGRDYLDHPASVGYVMPSIEVRIVRDDGNDAVPHEHGEICVRGVNVMSGYVGDPLATNDTLRDGWLRTGDIGWFDEDERLYLADRRKNMVVSGGENIYCAEVERVLGDYHGVAEVIAYGRPDDRLGERIAATVVLRPGVAIDPEQLRVYARTRLAGYKVPRDISVRNEPLHRTPTQKIDRGRFLRELDG